MTKGDVCANIRKSPAGGGKGKRKRKKFERKRKKFLTNGIGYAKLAKLLSEQRAIESPRKNLKKLEKSS